MTFFEWIIVVLVSVLIFLFGLAGVTGSMFLDQDRKNKRPSNEQ